jgi:hypothetical protein
MNIKGKLAALIAGCTLVLGGVALTTQPAAAASGDPGYVYAGTDVHTCASNACPVAWVTNYSGWLPFQCWSDTLAGGIWRRWFKLNLEPYWILADKVYNQPSLPQC